MERSVRNIPEMYMEMMTLLRNQGVTEQSRNGPVLSITEPLLVTVFNPLIRANVDPVRNCNPFFHVMEFVWMMAGERKVKWIAQFNKGMTQYAEDDGEIHAAYGWRWHKHFFVNQTYEVIGMLKNDPTTRRAVIGMWDASIDIYGGKRDLPCNTHIYFRIPCHTGDLDMTVCNRSNDVIWGMTGANAVHMTFLQELVANALGIEVGKYRVMTNNAHVYTELDRVEQMLTTTTVPMVDYNNWNHVPVLGPNESLAQFIGDCTAFVNDGGPFHSRWIHEVALPVLELWETRGDNYIADTQWKQACNLWLQRKL